MLVAQATVTIEKHELPQSGAVALRFVPEPAPGDAPQEIPTVFVIHGMNTRKERHLDLCLRLTRAGFVACAPDAALHGERANAQSRNLYDLAAPEFIPTFTHVVMQTVEDVAHLATDLGLTSYGVIGHSMGGFIGLHVLLADPRARALVVVSGVLDVSAADENYEPYADPVHRADEFAGRAVLLLHGDNDEIIPISGARKLHAALSPLYVNGSADRLSLVEIAGGGHEWTESIADQAVAWMKTHLKGEAE